MTHSKHILVICFQHCAILHFGLEAHLLEVSHADFAALTRCDVPGPNPDGKYAENMRSFVLPLKYNAPHSRCPGTHRTINIFFALITEQSAWIVIDSCRMVSFRIVTRSLAFKHGDLEPGSLVVLNLSLLQSLCSTYCPC